MSCRGLVFSNVWGLSSLLIIIAEINSAEGKVLGMAIAKCSKQPGWGLLPRPRLDRQRERWVVLPYAETVPDGVSCLDQDRPRRIKQPRSVTKNPPRETKGLTQWNVTAGQ
jgi:hypothetical protein